MPGRRNPLFPWSSAVIDALWESGTLQSVAWPDGNIPALKAEGSGYRAAVIVVLAKSALRDDGPEVAAERFRVFADRDLSLAFFSVEPVERERWLMEFRLRSLWRSRRGRPRDVVVAVRVCAVDCLAELCGLRTRDAIELWNRAFPDYAYGYSEAAGIEQAEAQFRVERRRVRSYMALPPKPKRGRGRPRTHFGLSPRRRGTGLSL